MGLLDNQSSELYYLGEISRYANYTLWSSGSYFEASETVSSPSNPALYWNTFSISQLAQPFLWRCGRALTSSDIRVLIESGDTNLGTNFTDNNGIIEVFDFTLSNNILIFSEDGDADPLFDDLNEVGADARVRIQLLDQESFLGDYRFTSLSDIVNSFMVAYVGDGKLINTVAKSDVIFHAKRGLQEFSYDVFRTIKSQEVELGAALSIPMPQDYVSYVKISFIGNDGIKRIIYPTRLTINPDQPIVQDSNNNYVFDDNGDILTGESITEERWDSFDTDNLTGRLNVENDYFVGRDEHLGYNYGERYGLEPEHNQINGYFTINERTGSFNFSSDLSGKIIVIEYVSDSLGTDAEMRVHKFAEEALYKHIAYNVLSAKAAVPEYVVQRYRKERRAAIRNAKIRLSKLNLEEMTQVMRGKTKHIKN
jgi:hypothetical protein